MAVQLRPGELEAEAQDPPMAPAAADEHRVAALVIPTPRGHHCVIVDGFPMIRNGQPVRLKSGAVQYWRCAEVGRGCRASGQSSAASTEIRMKKPHNHEASPAGVKAREARANVRTQAATNKLIRMPDIVDGTLTGMSNEAMAHLKRQDLMRAGNRARKNDDVKYINRDPAAIVWLDRFTVTATGQPFLLFDSRHEQAGEPVFFIWASANGVRLLRQYRQWAADGTFYCVPKQFDQLYTVHVHIGHSSVPAVYMLLPDRQATTYARAWRALIENAGLEGIVPESIMTDFERAALATLKTIFPEPATRLDGCLFHLAQAVFKNIAEKGLVLLYRHNERARVVLRMFVALALLPIGYVLEGFHLVVATLNGMLEAGEIDGEYGGRIQDFCHYFESTYIRRLDRQGNWVDAPFPVPLWNCYLLVVNGRAKTNNAVEAWHRVFKAMFRHAHMQMDQFIERLKTDEDRARHIIIGLERNPEVPIRRPPRPDVAQAGDQLGLMATRFYTNYGPAGLDRYLRAAQYHLHKAKFDQPAEAEDVADEETIDGGGGGGDGPEGDDGEEQQAPPAELGLPVVDPAQHQAAVAAAAPQLAPPQADINDMVVAAVQLPTDEPERHDVVQAWVNAVFTAGRAPPSERPGGHHGQVAADQGSQGSALCGHASQGVPDLNSQQAGTSASNGVQQRGKNSGNGQRRHNLRQAQA